MEVLYSILLTTAAFWLGACPFAVWLGRWRLRKDITQYGDGNPGSANVFRAGSIKLGLIAVLLDIAKGVPFVLISHLILGLPTVVVMAVGLSAILGHAFTPLLGFKGGKSIAVTFGVLLVLPQHEMLITFVIFLLLGFLLIEIDAWTVMFGAAGSLAYLAATKGGSWETLFMLCLLAILAVKHQKITTALMQHVFDSANSLWPNVTHRSKKRDD